MVGEFQRFVTCGGTCVAATRPAGGGLGTRGKTRRILRRTPAEFVHHLSVGVIPEASDLSCVISRPRFTASDSVAASKTSPTSARAPKPSLVSNSASSGFVHLHLHSEYSLLDGGNRLEALVARVKELGMTAVAVTDHGNLHGAMEFVGAAKDAGIKPILGIEAYVAPGDRRDRTPSGIADGGFHLVLLAENDEGWGNLLKLSSDAYVNGFYYKPRMDKSTLAQWGDGLIAINGHLGSSIAYHLELHARTSDEKHWQAALAEARWHAETFRPNEKGDPRFYIELQRHVPEQERINPLLKKLARELALPLVCDNDAHFLRAEDHDVHDTLCCISMGKNKEESQRYHYPQSLYVKSPAEMAALFAEDDDEREALANTVRIADRCVVTFAGGASHAPVVRVRRIGEPPRFDPSADVTTWFKAFCANYELLPFESPTDAKGGGRADGAGDAAQAQTNAQTNVQTNVQTNAQTNVRMNVRANDQMKAECDLALRELAEAGVVWRYGPEFARGAGPTELSAGVREVRERLERELAVLADKSISAYFLIVWDFVNWARQRGIPAMARGSGVGTMVGYVLGLSNACPVKYGLLFERFTDPDRSEYPDIDIDICQDGRGAVIDYVRRKYGYVAQIITFGRLKARAAIKDVARVMGMLPSDGQALANLVPQDLGITIEEALQKEPRLKERFEKEPLVRRVIETATALEDHARHAGVHAAGVVIATQPLESIVPLCKTSGSDEVVTQWDGPTCEKVGLLKMDFLGLRTLSTIELARKLIVDAMPDEAIWHAVGRRAPSEVGRGEYPGPHPLDLDRIPLDDQRVLDLFRRGETAGIFQFESGGMRKLLIDMKPDRLDDLIAANALFRPGPMDLIPDYNARKHGRQSVPSMHEVIERYTGETYGIMVYQEQVMQVLHGLGGIPLRAAYTIIKAISKKKQETINAARADFVGGATERGVTREAAGELFELILKFAGYGFNKSHSTGYAIIAYQTAYLKTYFPGHFMGAVLSFESQASKIDEWSMYLEECRRVQFPDHSAASPHVGVEVRAPDVNLSEPSFSIVYGPDEPHDHLHGHIRFGLGAIKGAGEGATRTIVDERRTHGPFVSLFDFCERVDLRGVNRATIEALVKAGAFDSLHGADSRAAVAASIDKAVRAGQDLARDRQSGQMNMFGAAEPSAVGTATTQSLEKCTPWERRQMLAFEKEALGFHVSGHPLDSLRPLLWEFATIDTIGVQEAESGRVVAIGGVMTRVVVKPANSGKSAGQRMAQLTLEDQRGTLDGVIFPESFAEYGHVLQPDAMVILCGTIDRSRGPTNIIVDHAYPLEAAPQHLAMSIELRFVESNDERSDPLPERMRLAAGLLRQATGVSGAQRGRAVPVHISIAPRDLDGRVVRLTSKVSVLPDPALLSQLRDLVGEGDLRVVGGYVPRRERKTWNRTREPVGAG